MKKVLITGATGFLGRHAIEAIQKQQWQEIHAVSRLSQSDSRIIQWHKADLLCSDDVQQLIQNVRPTHLLHCAWETTPEKYWELPQNYLWSQMGQELIETFHQHGGKRVVVAGTCAEYDWGIQEDFVEDKTPLDPVTVYGKSKRDLYLALDKYIRNNDLQVAWARIFYVYGPFEYEGRLISSVIKALLNDREFECQRGNLVKDFLHISDVGHAMSVLLQSDIKGPINIASGQGISLGNLIGKVAAILGKEDLINIDYSSRLSKPGDRIVGSIHRLKDELKWAPRYSLEEGLRQTIDWWLCHLELKK